MTVNLTYKPSIVSGLYPEKEWSTPGILDHLLAKFTRKTNNNFRHNRQKLFSVVRSIHRFAEGLAELDDAALAMRIQTCRENLLQKGLEDECIMEAFALIREVAWRKLKMRHYDVQLIGGWVIIKGMIAEMETGEGKTLVATLPACVAAMAGIPVHIITVNDYLVTRDAALMTPVYQTFGLTVGIITEGMDAAARQAAYACDITYCSNKQLTFDYLKDRLVLGRKHSRLNLQLGRLHDDQSGSENRLLLRGLCFAIVDEADSVLIDESRTPLILSREYDSLEQLHIYQQALDIAKQLKEIKDFFIDHRNRSIELTAAGVDRVKQQTAELNGIWSAQRRSRELVIQALTAIYLFIKDVNYLVKDGKVMIVDEFTGRVMPDRSWERGLHQLIETKEGCAISGQKETLCRISYQAFFRRYLHLAGMTGTAMEVSDELFSVYQQSVIRVPTNKPCIRAKFPTRYFLTAHQKWLAIVDRVVQIHQLGRPVLIGTRSVEASEYLGAMLDQKQIPHQILNARQDAFEAEIIKAAGTLGSITVATNMAGRGTDIKLGSGVEALGGLHVIASECHESRRIDRQLFGRCGRQGDAGSYEMFLSFEDEIMTKFSPGLLRSLAKTLIHLRLSGVRFWGAILFYLAQTQAERYHAATRKRLLKMDENLQNLLAFTGKTE